MSLLGSPEPQGYKARAATVWLETAENERFPVQGACTMGRSASNGLVLAGERVSRQHASIQVREESDYWLTDLGSVNGTWLNGARIRSATRIYHLDQIAVGPHRLVFHQPGGPTRPAVEHTIGEMTLADAKPEYCWILVVELDSPSRVEKSVPADRMTVVLGGWLDQCKQVIDDHGGAICRYLGQGFLAFWPDQGPNRSRVGEALKGLTQLQSKAQPPFRLVLHYGPVNVSHTGECGGASVAGVAVNFALRMDKLGGAVRAVSLVSEVAQALLQPWVQLAPLGRHVVHGFEGEHLFFQVAASAQDETGGTSN